MHHDTVSGLFHLLHPGLVQHACSSSDLRNSAEHPGQAAEREQNRNKYAGGQVVHALRRGHQAMVFVHSRKDTGKTARTLFMKAQQAGQTADFDCSEQDNYGLVARDVKRSRNRCVRFHLLQPCSGV